MIARVCLWLATGLGISYIAPTGRGRKWTGAGFLGTVEGLLLWPLLPAAANAYAFVVTVMIVAACGICGSAEKSLKSHDDSRIVLDEIVGFWVAAAWLPRTWTAALLAFDTLGVTPDDKTVYYFAGIDGARFKRPVEPGDQLLLHAELDRMKSGIFKFKARAMVLDQLAVEAELICTMRTIA